jgi:3-phosphoinositide dependent protein kinase-1
MGSSVDDGSMRNSFVGTQDYVSPEVLSGEKAATKACDLWAVGCMIFQILSGRSPFRAATEYLTFELIMGHCKGTHPLDFPPVITPDTRDIILGFLRVSDIDRLGAGEDSGDNGYPAVKRHAFFEGVQWGRLVGQTAPHQPDSSKFPSTDHMRDGAADEWDLEGDPTPIDDSRHHAHNANSSSNNSNGKADDVRDGVDHQTDTSSIRLGAPSVSTSAEFDEDRLAVKWKRFLYENEKQVFTGLVYKRKV